jgi:hypothetical protein
VIENWPLPRDPDYFLQRLGELQGEIRERLRRSTRAGDIAGSAAPVDERGGDTIFALDLGAEETVERFFAAWGEELPLLLVAEGIPGDGSRTFPAVTPRERVAFTCIVDPIDGTRGLMYQKRSAWTLAGIAPPPNPALPRLDQIVVAMQTELPTPRSELSDALWAVRGRGVEAETRDLRDGTRHSFRPAPSAANSLHYGFATISKFFPGGKIATAEIEERLFRAVTGVPPDGNPLVFDDEYISTAGQLYELMVGHDRFIADLRPLIFARSGLEGTARGLCAHPYDLCTELIAREAGVIVTDAAGGPLRDSLDIRRDCAWIGYANQRLRAVIEPVLRSILEGP